MRQRPRLSVVVVVHRMPAQALATVRSLGPSVQEGVAAREYEIVVVENASDRTLDPAAVAAAAPNATYVRREEAGRSPAGAVNDGLRRARGDAVAVMVDGARMVTPGVVAGTLSALRAADLPVVAVPGYHLGSQLQGDAARAGYDERAEALLLAGAGWPGDGYALFDVAVPSASCRDGFLRPMGEANFLALPRDAMRALGGCDRRFTSPGGGYVNLDLYRRACELPGATLLVLAGEGTFHQFHGGVTTGAADVDRDALFAEFAAEYERIRGHGYAPPDLAPVLHGRVGASAARFLERSARLLREAA